MKIFVYTAFFLAMLAFVQNVSAAPKITPRDSATALLDTTKICSNLYGKSLNKWHNCVEPINGYMEVDYFEYKNGTCTREWYIETRQNHLYAFTTKEKKKIEKKTSYMENGFIDRVCYNTTNSCTYYRGRTAPFTGKDTSYINGELYSISEYKNGKRNGYHYIFYPNGSIESKIFFKNGKPEGTEYVYEQGGRTTLTRKYNKDGHFVSEDEYHENGQVKSTTPFKNGQANGIMKEFSQEGTLIALTEFKDNMIVRKKNCAIEKYDKNKCEFDK